MFNHPLFQLFFNPMLPHTFNLVAFAVWLMFGLMLILYFIERKHD